MTAAFLSPGALLSFSLLVALGTGCTHARDASSPSSRDAPVTADDIARAPGQPIENILMARVPGLWAVRTPDGYIALLIRGASTIRGDGEPLYVIDGMPTLPGPNGKLTGINPYDIESISVLKDAAASAIYGLRAVHGAIVITTKQGKSSK